MMNDIGQNDELYGGMLYSWLYRAIANPPPSTFDQLRDNNAQEEVETHSLKDTSPNTSKRVGDTSADNTSWFVRCGNVIKLAPA